MNYNYTSSHVFSSQIFPGVQVTLKKRSATRRSEFNRAVAKLNAQLRDLEIEGEVAEASACLGCSHPVAKHSFFANKCGVEGCKCEEGHGPGFAKRSYVLMEISKVDRDQLQPERLRVFVQKIEGFDIEGVPATVDSLVADGPDELLDEIDAEIKRLLTLSEDERKNSASPTTSGAPEGTATSDSTAPGAVSSTSIPAATA